MELDVGLGEGEVEEGLFLFNRLSMEKDDREVGVGGESLLSFGRSSFIPAFKSVLIALLWLKFGTEVAGRGSGMAGGNGAMKG